MTPVLFYTYFLIDFAKITLICHECKSGVKRIRPLQIQAQGAADVLGKGLVCEHESHR